MRMDRGAFLIKAINTEDDNNEYSLDRSLKCKLLPTVATCTSTSREVLAAIRASPWREVE